MAKQVAKSGLMAKLGAKLEASFKAHKDDETKFSAGDLPAGIEGGVAKLIECCFKQIEPGKKNAGEYLFYAAGTVISPTEVNGCRTEGGQTRIMENLFDTPEATGRKTFDEHVDWVMNELRKLGATTKDLPNASAIETACAALKKANIHFSFRTWKGAKQTTGPYAGQEPRTNHQWNGFIKDYKPGQTVAPVDDNTVPDATPTEEVNEQVEEPAAEEGAVTDWAALGVAADGGDSKAMLALTDAAKTQLGMDDKGIDAAASWGALAEQLAGGGGDGSAEDGATSGSDDEWKPAKEDVYKYTPEKKGPGGQPMKGKTIEVEVVGVDETKKTVELKNLEDGKTVYKAIAWEKLEASS